MGCHINRFARPKGNWRRASRRPFCGGDRVIEAGCGLQAFVLSYSYSLRLRILSASSGMATTELQNEERGARNGPERNMREHWLISTCFDNTGSTFLGSQKNGAWHLRFQNIDLKCRRETHLMPNQSAKKLCPAQKRAFDSLSAGIEVGAIHRLWGGIGRGKTTVLRELHKQVGGGFLNMKDFVEASSGKHPLALEETLYQLIVDTLKAHPLVIVDDVHLLDLFSAGCHFYPRSGYFNSIMMGLCTYALEAKKKLIFGTKSEFAEAAAERSYSFGIERFKVE